MIILFYYILGQVFCMQVMACVSNCDFFEIPDDDIQAAPSPGALSCPAGEVYCMSDRKCKPSWWTCYSDISVYDQQEEHYNRPGGKNYDNGICPEGKVWCMRGKICVSPSQSCDNEGKTMQVCPLDKIWCGSSCDSKCDDKDTCPKRESVNTIGYSTCQVECFMGYFEQRWTLRTTKEGAI